MNAIFTVSTENDGLMDLCFSNIMALHNFLTNDLKISDTPLSKSEITLIDKDFNHIKYSYNYQKLVYCIRNNQKNNRTCVAQINDENIGNITISELQICTR